MALHLSNRTFIIAEAGTCHAGPDQEIRMAKAIAYVHAAKYAGADAVKFQIFLDPNPETMFCWIQGDEDRAPLWYQSAMEYSRWERVKNLADELDIMFLASAFEYETVLWQSELEVKATKVASRAASYLEVFKDAPRPLLVSNGMANVAPADDRIILQCEANYPSTAKWTGEYPGFSDHSGNPWRAIDAIDRGCKLIEVHFYIDPEDSGPNLPASLTCDELKLVCDARDAYAEMQ